MPHLSSELTGCTVTVFCWETQHAVVAWAHCIIANIRYLNRLSSFSLAQPWQRGANELHDNMLPCYCFEITQVFLPVRLFLDNWPQNIRQLFLKTNYLLPPSFTTKVIFHPAIMYWNQCSDVDIWCFFFFCYSSSRSPSPSLFSASFSSFIQHTGMMAWGRPLFGT